MGWLVFAILMVLLGALAAGGSGRSRRRSAQVRDVEITPEEDFDLVTPERLAREGTEATIAELVAQGRADDLRGLGYRGDLPDR